VLASLEPRWTWKGSETVVRILLFLTAAFAVAATFAIVIVLTFDTVVFFGQVSPVDFYTGTKWSPIIDGLFGVLPLVVGSLMIAGGAVLVGIPLGLSSAIFLREYAPARLREFVKPILEVLSGIPSIVFGFFALVTVSPTLQRWFGADFFNGANAFLVIGIMIIPLVSSLSEDAMTAVPTDLRDGALALGATRFEATGRVVVPAALSGVLASFLLAFSRAVGETMVVLIAAGENVNLTFDLFGPMSTLAGDIARKATGDLPVDSNLFRSLFAVGFTLFVMTFVVNIVSQYLRSRFREEYE
jgi:phosphate transport system permease protein